MKIQSNIHELEQHTIQEMQQANAYLYSQLKIAAEYEKQNHLYHNRTGNLQHSTEVIILEDNLNDYSVDIQITMDYAQYVYNKKLMVIDLATQMAEQNIDNYMQQFA